ncbi:hypothetical protein Q7C36_009044 [Tachysurus vachellii]|uniref:IBR domain-containing protein n=1 Tax=Tachysurus vachellii TaxID=175792 RepID=A0AA88SVQ2_TACVA|nr:hypothetical protein Q7C36_009044 [Tachysurus vachellii]
MEECGRAITEYFRAKPTNKDVKDILSNGENNEMALRVVQLLIAHFGEDLTGLILLTDVKLLVNEDEFERYDCLLLKNCLDQMPDIVYCPVTTCSKPVTLEPNSNLGKCFYCNYAFCILCILYLSHRAVREQSNLVEMYLASS